MLKLEILDEEEYKKLKGFENKKRLNKHNLICKLT